MEIENLKKMLGLRPLENEGGFYAESYRSDEKLPRGVLPTRYSGDRSSGTAIYYLLTPETFSAIHRLASDEVYHFYLGDPVELLVLHEKGSGGIVTLGADFDRGMTPQFAVHRGSWQGSRLLRGGKFALLGTTMAPGFDFADFELARRDVLLVSYPRFATLIRELTR